MRSFYLFKLKNTNLKLNKLYSNLEELFYLNTNKFNYGKRVFNDLCLPFDKEYIKKKLNLKIFDEDIFISNICIVIKTTRNFPEVFKYLNRLEDNILVCDFNNNDYFLLNDFIRLNFKLAI